MDLGCSISNPNHPRPLKLNFPLYIWIGITAMALLTGCTTGQGVMHSAFAGSNLQASRVTEGVGSSLNDVPETPRKKYKSDPSAPSSEDVLSTAFTQLGKPYRYGGTSPETGFDCAGFVQWVYAQNGIKLPRTSREHLSVGQEVDKEELMPGDILIYYRGRGRRGTHVGIYTGDGKYIHSPRTGDRIKISSAFDRYSNARFIKAVRVLNDNQVHPLTADEKNALKVAARTAKLEKRNAKVRRSTYASSQYRVKRGDTLSTIAKRYGLTVKDLRRANQINKGKPLMVGQKLQIPGQDTPAGNVDTSSQTQTASFSAPKESKGSSKSKARNQSYTVTKGDTLSQIAKKFRLSSKDLARANGMSATSVLHLGQKLTIPGTSSSATKPSSKTTAKTRTKKTYKVRQGDTIWDIAKKFDVPSKTLVVANGLDKGSTLRVGQQLVIPQ